MKYVIFQYGSGYWDGRGGFTEWPGQAAWYDGSVLEGDWSYPATLIPVTDLDAEDRREQPTQGFERGMRHAPAWPVQHTTWRNNPAWMIATDLEHQPTVYLSETPNEWTYIATLPNPHELVELLRSNGHALGENYHRAVTDQPADHPTAGEQDGERPEMLCPACEGARVQWRVRDGKGMASECKTCGGAGRVPENTDWTWQHCIVCKGSGERHWSGPVPCDTCNASGWVPSFKTRLLRPCREYLDMIGKGVDPENHPVHDPSTGDEAERRGKPYLYQRAWNKAAKSCGVTITDTGDDHE